MKKSLLSLLSAGVLAVACSPAEQANPLLEDWNTPFGIPPFEQVKPEHYLPAFKEAMAQEKAEIDAIVNNPDEPTFENTILAYNNTGELLSRVSSVFSSVSGVRSDDVIRAIAKELSPIRSAHSNEIRLNDKLFQRIKAVYDKRDELDLTRSQMRLLTEIYKGFESGGANLPEDKKAELKRLNTELSTLQLDFGQNLLTETAAYILTIDNEDDLKGLTDGQIAEAASRAEKAGQPGKWMFGLDNPSIMPFLENAENRELRRQMLDAYLTRANHDDAADNKEIIKKLVDLRMQRAQLLGYESCAAYILEDRMAKTPEAVYDLLDQVWGPALKAAKAEAADMRNIIAREGSGIDLEACDWRFYFQKSMNDKFDLSEAQLAPYFRMENVREGIFYVANRLYGITFKQLENVPLPHPDATAFECLDEDGSHLGVVFFDMFARPGEKRGGAWCGGFRSSYYKDGVRVAPLVSIVGNFTRPVGDQPALLTTDEVETYFHEFGHGLASLFKQSEFRRGPGYPTDFVELPSQIMEHWAFHPEVLKVYAKHYQTGETIPQELIDKLEKAGKYGQGFATVEYLAASYLDMDYHVLTSMPENLDVNAFEAKVLGDRGLIPQIPPRYRSTYFNHTFGGGYTAGYYSYIWAEVLDSDAFEAFVETGDIFDRATANRFRNEVLAKSADDDAMNLYLNFRGKKPGIEPLLRNRGLK